jgi:hypothetical protein
LIQLYIHTIRVTIRPMHWRNHQDILSSIEQVYRTRMRPDPPSLTHVNNLHLALRVTQGFSSPMHLLLPILTASILLNHLNMARCMTRGLGTTTSRSLRRILIHMTGHTTGYTTRIMVALLMGVLITLDTRTVTVNTVSTISTPGMITTDSTERGEVIFQKRQQIFSKIGLLPTERRRILRKIRRTSYV